ncbi:DUF89 domain-containing protein [Planctomycetota bacterium]
MGINLQSMLPGWERQLKSVAECYQCIFDDLDGALDILNLSTEMQAEIRRIGHQYMDEDFPLQLLPSEYITEIHRIVKRVSGLALPFRELRENCNRIGIKIAGGIRDQLRGLEPFARFEKLVLWSVAGNHLDFRTVGAGYGFGTSKIQAMLQEKVDDGFDVNDLEQIFNIVRSGPRILYIPDNVGELAFDRLLMEELKSFGAVIQCPYRGGPITSDAVHEDFITIGIDKIADEIFLAGPDTLGISWREKTPVLANALQEAEVVIAKGQANFYVTHEHQAEIPGSIINLLTTKCNPVSQLWGKQDRINVASVMK